MSNNGVRAQIASFLASSKTKEKTDPRLIAAVFEVLEGRQLLSVTPTFSAPTAFVVGNGPIAVISADLNNDGNMDFVSADSQSGTITIRRGRGDGTFRPSTTINVGADPTSIIAADFNKDGKMDLAVAVAGTNQVKVFLGSGDGATFTASATLAAGDLSVDPARAFGTGAKLAVGDFDGDGKLDLAVTNPNAVKVVTFLGQGNGTFATGATTQLPGAANLAGLTAGDFNHDGKTDLAVVTDFNLDILFGSTGGNFTTSLATQPVSQGDPNYLDVSDGHDIVAADFNGDGQLDLAFVNGDEDGGAVILGSASGTFDIADATGFGTSLDGFTDRGPNALVAADLNGDGKMDLAVTNLTDSTRAYIINNGNGTWTTTETPTYLFGDDLQNTPPTAVPVDAIAAGDFNNDGKIDLLMATGEYAAGSRSVNLFLNSTSGLQVFPPSVNPFAGTYDSSAKTITLTATASETNGVISSVDFYDDSGLATGLLGHGTLVSGQWTLTIDASSLGNGEHTFYAVANDTYGYSSDVSTIVTVSQAAPVQPTIGSFTVNPNSTTVGGGILLSSAASESGGSISSVKFYADTDGTAGLNTATDTLLGAGTNNSGTWSLSTTTTGLRVGTVTLYAVATDATNQSAQTTTSLINNPNPVNVGPLVIAPQEAAQGETVTLSTTASESGGTIASVKFYVNTAVDMGGPENISDGTLIGSGTLSNGVWSITYNTAGLSIGSHTLYAEAFDSIGQGHYVVNDITIDGPVQTPTNLTAAANSANGVTLQWTTNGATHFEIQYATNNSFTGATSVIQEDSVNNNSDYHFVNGLSPSTPYFFRIRGLGGLDNGAMSDWSNTASATTFVNGTVPAKPTNIVATVGTGTITVKWTNPPGTITGYVVQRSTSYDFFTNLVSFSGGASATSFVDTTTAANTWYYYRVQVTNAAGYSNASSSVKVRSGKTAGSGVQPTVPSQPSGLTGVANSSTQITLNWTDTSSNETGFILQRSNSAVFANPTTINIAANAKSYIDTGVSPNMTYFYRIAATNSTGTSAYFADANAIITPASGGGGATSKQATPTGFTATAMTGAQIQLAWGDAAVAETGYEIQVSTVFNFATITQDVTIAAGSTGYTVTGLSKSTWYYVRVRAVTTPATFDSDYTASIKLKTLST